MPIFTYQVIDKSGALATGQVEAENEQMAAGRLRKMGLKALDIKEVRTSPLKGMFQARRKVKIGELSLFSRQLAAMLDAGIPLTRALFTFSRQADNPTLRITLGDVARNVEGGTGFSAALKDYPAIFSNLYISMVHAGEVGGSMELMLRNLSEQLEHEKNLKDQVRSATFYPLLVISFAVLVLVGMLFFIVPMFMNFLPQGVAVPLPTRIVFGASESVRHWWFLYLLVIAALVAGMRFYIHSPQGGRAWDRVKFRVPAFGTLFHKAVIARFSRTFSTLLSGGIPVLQALEAAGPASGNILVADAVKSAVEKIQEGTSIAVPLEESGMFPPMVIQMVAVGEESGTLSNLLSRVAEFYEAEVTAMTKGRTALIEPIMIIVVGCLIGAMVVSMYLPIFMVVTSAK
ncbi:MAG: type II secretion system F family protein [Eubacteriales bacterium]